MELNPFKKRWRIVCVRRSDGAEIPWEAPQREPRFRSWKRADAECWRWNQFPSHREKFFYEVRAIR